MAVGFHKLNSSAARRRISDGRAQKDVPDVEKQTLPVWLHAKALFRKGERVTHTKFGVGEVQNDVLSVETPVRVMFSVGILCMNSGVLVKYA